MTSTLPVFVVDRMTCLSRLILVETIACYLAQFAVVQIEDSSRPRSMRLCYEVQPAEAAIRLFNVQGRQIGVFASVAALVDYAEAVTGVTQGMMAHKHGPMPVVDRILGDD